MSFLHIPIQEITLNFLNSLLIDNPVAEGQHIEYKRDMPRNEKLCEAMASFANAQGGDLLIGIEESGGIPTSIHGIECTDVDQEKLRLLNIFRNGIEPRLVNIDIEFINTNELRYVIIIRTKRSWIRPHRVTHNSKYFARQSNGKYELDVQQLRQMFLGNAEFAEKYTEFHEGRVSYHINEFNSKPLVLVHFVPVSAFENLNVIDLSGVFNRVRTVPISTTHDNRRINFIGVYSESNDKASKFQLFRNGVIEQVTTRLIVDRKISGAMLAESLRVTFSNAFQNYRQLGIREPIYVMVSLYGVQGLMPTDIDPFYSHHEIVPYDSDKMIFPEVFIEDVNETILSDALKPIMDALWNAYGYTQYMHSLD